jgi:hypothetical protein
MRHDGNRHALQVEIDAAAGFGPQAVVMTDQSLVVGMVGARLDHVEVGAGETASQRYQAAERLAQAAQARRGQPAPQLAQQQAVGDDKGAAVQPVEKPTPPRSRNFDAGFERQRDIGAVVFGARVAEQGLYASQQRGFRAQVRARQQQRARRRRCGATRKLRKLFVHWNRCPAGAATPGANP